VLKATLIRSFFVRKLTLGKAHDEDEVDGDKPEQVSRHHSVYHDYRWPSQFEASENRKQLQSVPGKG
jgi:hypothetical protein